MNLLSKNTIPIAEAFEDCQDHFSCLARSISATLVTMYRNHNTSWKQRKDIRLCLDGMEKSLEQLADNLREL